LICGSWLVQSRGDGHTAHL